MKNIDKFTYNNFLKSYFASKQALIMNEDGVSIAFINGITEDDLLSFNVELSLNLDKFIEEELKENPKEYNRSVVMYETKSSENGISFYW
jgi:hypothetical protein